MPSRLFCRSELKDAYNAYSKALLRHKVEASEAARQKDMEDARHAEAAAYGKRISGRLG